MPTTLCRPRRLVATSMLLAALVLPAAAFGDRTASAEPSPAADDALDWLGGQLVAGGGSLPASFGPGSDWGLTADAVLAHVAAGRGAEAPAQTATDLLLDHVDDYTSWNDLGPAYSGVRLAGPLGKVVLVAEAQGRDVSAVGGTDLEAALRSLVVTSGTQRGRFADRNPHAPDNSNGFGQALSILALSSTDAGVPPASVEFLIAQQCPNGGFRLFYTGGVGCTSSSEADPDSTALALQALLAAPRTPASSAALSDGVGWLISIQDPATGAWAGSGPTAVLNANSTGLVSQALRASGHEGPAERGAAWVRDQLQLSSARAVGTPAGSHVGAIAYRPGQLTSALTDGLPSSALDQWRRATVQGVLALGLTRYGPANGEPLPTTSVPSPTTAAPTTAAPTTTPPATTPPTTTPPTTTPPTTTPPTTTPPTTAPPTTPPPTIAPPTIAPWGPGAPSEVRDRSEVRGDRTSTHARRSAPTRAALALTGIERRAVAWAGVLGVLVGLAALGASRVRPSRGGRP